MPIRKDLSPRSGSPWPDSNASGARTRARDLRYSAVPVPSYAPVRTFRAQNCYVCLGRCGSLSDRIHTATGTGIAELAWHADGGLTARKRRLVGVSGAIRRSRSHSSPRAGQPAPGTFSPLQAASAPHGALAYRAAALPWTSVPFLARRLWFSCGPWRAWPRLRAPQSPLMLRPCFFSNPSLCGPLHTGDTRVLPSSRTQALQRPEGGMSRGSRIPDVNLPHLQS